MPFILPKPSKHLKQRAELLFFSRQEFWVLFSLIWDGNWWFLVDWVDLVRFMMISETIEMIIPGFDVFGI